MYRFECSRRAFLGLASSGLICAAGLSACSASSGAGTLKVGVRCDIVGMSQLNEDNGKYYGMEIDLAEELASRLGYAGVEYTTVTPEDRKEKLQDGDVDCLIACYSVSDSRKKNFDFSPAYYEDAVVLVAQTSSLYTQLADLKGATIGTMAGANTAPVLLEKFVELGFCSANAVSGNADNTDVQFDTWRLREYDTYQDLSDALEEGEVDAMAMDGSISSTYIDQWRTTIEDFEASPQDYAVATQKDSDLSAKVAEAVQDMIDDGTIETLTEKWK